MDCQTAHQEAPTFIYLLVDSLPSLNTSWQGSWGNVHKALNGLREQCASANINDPYIPYVMATGLQLLK